jgi:hypothetical protein
MQHSSARFEHVTPEKYAIRRPIAVKQRSKIPNIIPLRSTSVRFFNGKRSQKDQTTQIVQLKKHRLISQNFIDFFMACD